MIISINVIVQSISGEQLNFDPKRKVDFTNFITSKEILSSELFNFEVEKYFITQNSTYIKVVYHVFEKSQWFDEAALLVVLLISEKMLEKIHIRHHFLSSTLTSTKKLYKNKNAVK